MAYSQEYLDYVLDQLGLFGDIQVKKMFGGIGLFHEGKMFGMIGDDVFRLKADDHNRVDYEAAGMAQFSSGSGKQGMPYWEVPAEIVEDPNELKAWADKAYAAAVRAKK